MKRFQPTRRKAMKNKITDRLEKFKRSANRQAHRFAPLLERKRKDKDAFAMAQMGKWLEKRLKRYLEHYKPYYPDCADNTATVTAPARRMWSNSPTAM